MPHSRFGHIPTVLGAVSQLSPVSILEVGVTTGTWGSLLREYLGPDAAENDPSLPPRGIWQGRIDGILVRTGLVMPVLERLYDQLRIGDPRARLEDAGLYDVVLLDRFLDDLPAAEGRDLLGMCLNHARQAVIVVTLVPEEGRRSYALDDFPAVASLVANESADGLRTTVLLRKGVRPPSFRIGPRWQSLLGDLVRCVGGLADRTIRRLAQRDRDSSVDDFDSAAFWESRYRSGGNSGDGSYGRLANFKARIINDFVAEFGIERVVEFGAGDGNQLSLLRIPRYTGLDVSPTAIAWLRTCYAKDATKRFLLIGGGAASPIAGETFDLSLSLDVIYHLIEDAVFERYMRDLFAASRRFVLIYASDRDRRDAPHVRDREFSRFVCRELPEWRLLRHFPNEFPEESRSSFFIYERTPVDPDFQGPSTE